MKSGKDFEAQGRKLYRTSSLLAFFFRYISVGVVAQVLFVGMNIGTVSMLVSTQGLLGLDWRERMESLAGWH